MLKFLVTADILCFRAPEWLSSAHQAAERVQETSPSSLAGLIVAFVFGFQAASWGMGESLTRFSTFLAKKAAPPWLSALVWGLGVVFGKFGWGTPKRVKEKEAREKEEHILKKVKAHTQVFPSDVGKYVRYNGLDGQKFFGKLIEYNKETKIAYVKDAITHAVHSTGLSFLKLIDED
jgi:hypothetical protein